MPQKRGLIYSNFNEESVSKKPGMDSDRNATLYFILDRTGGGGMIIPEEQLCMRSRCPRAWQSAVRSSCRQSAEGWSQSGSQPITCGNNAGHLDWFGLKESPRFVKSCIRKSEEKAPVAPEYRI